MDYLLSMRVIRLMERVVVVDLVEQVVVVVMEQYLVVAVLVEDVKEVGVRLID